MDKSLFGNVNLSSMDFLEVPGAGETSVTTAPVVETDKSKDKPTDTAIQEEDNFIEIPDTVEPITTKVDDIEKSLENEEKEIVETKVNKETKDSPEVKGNSSSSPLFESFAKALYEGGVLTSYDEAEFKQLVEEVGPAEALIELNKRTLLDEIESYKSESEEEYKSFLEAKEAGVDLNDWAKSQELKAKYKDIDDSAIESDVDLQKSIILTDLKRKGMDDETIRETIESFEDTGKLDKQAKNSFKNLKKAQEDDEKELVIQAKKREEESIKTQKAQIEHLKKTITDTKEIIPGMILNKEVKDSIFSMITTPVKQDANGQALNAVMAKRAEDPIKYALMEAYFVKLGLFDGKFDKIVAKAKTQAVKELETKLSTNNNTNYISGGDGLDKGTESEYAKEFGAAFSRIKI
jgi:hypothetical protein